MNHFVVLCTRTTENYHEAIKQRVGEYYAFDSKRGPTTSNLQEAFVFNTTMVRSFMTISLDPNATRWKDKFKEIQVRSLFKLPEEKQAELGIKVLPVTLSV